MNNIKTYILTLLVTILGSLSAMADNVVSITGFDIAQGETKELSVVLKNADPVSTLQVEFILPKGITVNNYEGDKFQKVGRALRHSLSVGSKEDDGREAYQLLLTSTSLREMAAGEEAVVTFEVKAANDFNPISFIEITKVEGGNKTTEKLIDQQTTELVVNEKAHFQLSVDAVSGKSGDIIPVTVNLENKVKISHLQAKIVLPEGLEIVPDAEGYLYTPSTRTANLEVDGNKLADNQYSLLISSTSNIEVKGSEGAILSFNVKATKALNDTSISIIDVICSDNESNSIKVKGIEIPVTILANEDYNGDGVFDIDDVQKLLDDLLNGNEEIMVDYNNDGVKDIDDVQYLLDALLNQ